MILTDAGPLVALLDRDERDHEACAAVLKTLQPPMVTTWAAFTEAMYLLGESGGWQAQNVLWGWVSTGDLQLHDLDAKATARAAKLMEKYHDLPMDLADATLVALAEHLRVSRVFTLDADFQIYRLPGNKAFRIVPQRR
jgi:predicted nucleic acid-binding protein